MNEPGRIEVARAMLRLALDDLTTKIEQFLEQKGKDAASEAP